jgi:hypothetical protein
MLPSAYLTPAAVVFAIGGFLACFAGYRLFRFVLGINGFILGALLTTSAMGTSSMWALAVAAIVGGLVGAVLMIAAYFVGVAIVGAGVVAGVGVVALGCAPPGWGRLLQVLFTQTEVAGHAGLQTDCACATVAAESAPANKDAARNRDVVIFFMRNPFLGEGDCQTK